MEDSDKPKETSDKPDNKALALKQLKSIKVALWMLVTVFVILPVIAGIGTGVVVGIIAMTAGSVGEESFTTEAAGEGSVDAPWEMNMGTEMKAVETQDAGGKESLFKNGTGGCPDGHKLMDFLTPDSNYWCDVCGRTQLPKGTHMFGCRICNWDKCEKCARK